MNLMLLVDSWGLLHWLIFFILLGFVFLWITGTKGLTDIEERWFRIERFDEYYEYPGGFLLLHVRNLAVVILLVIILKVL